MKIKKCDVERFAALLEAGVTVNTVVEREYGRCQDMLTEAKTLRGKALNEMREAADMADRADRLVDQADKIRKKYEEGGMLHEFDEAYQEYADGWEDE